MDKPALTNHQGTQGTDRRVATFWRKGRTTVCHPDGYHNQRVVGHDNWWLQTLQRVEERESPRQYDHDGIFLEAKLGTALTAKIYDLQKGIKNLDPVELLKNARKVYEQFMEDGEVMFGAETITTEEELKSKFTEFLSDEEIAGIFKGGVE